MYGLKLLSLIISLFGFIQLRGIKIDLTLNICLYFDTKKIIFMVGIFSCLYHTGFWPFAPYINVLIVEQSVCNLT